MELPRVNTSSATDRLAGSVAPAFSLSTALRLAFNIIDPIAFPGVKMEAEQSYPDMSFQGVRTVTQEEAEMSPMGTAIMFPIKFNGGAYQRYTSDGQVELVDMGEYRLPLTCVAEFSRSKEMTTTKTVASQGTVKEIYGHADWDVRISGFLLDEANQPNGATTLASQRDRVLAFERLADSIEVQGELFTAFRIYRLAIVGVQFGQMPGKPDMMPFQLTCLSDEPLELVIE